MQNFEDFLRLAAINCPALVLGVERLNEEIKLLIVIPMIYERKETEILISFPTHYPHQQHKHAAKPIYPYG